jgi:predicted nucleotidyltransferase
MISNDSINQAVNIVVQTAHPKAVILFGSYARGNASEESDVDLCVVEDSLVDKRMESVRIRRALSPLRIPVDIIVHSAQTVREWGEVTGTLINSILQEGKILYEKK